MHPTIRKVFPLVMLCLALGAVVWAASFGQLPRADFTFTNGTEIQSIDTTKITGQPEGRIADALFEGLYRELPSKADPSITVPMPGVAESHTLSADGKVYTFTLRKNAFWVNAKGEKVRAVTAHDFWWSWRRMLHPETASEYSYQLFYIQNASKYTEAEVGPGDLVEVELMKLGEERKVREEPFPNGKNEIVYGKLLEIVKPPEPKYVEGNEKGQKRERNKQRSDWQQQWIYRVQTDAGTRLYSKQPEKDRGDVAACHQVLYDFRQVGIKVIDDQTLEVSLTNNTPFFLSLTAFYPLYPTMRECVQEHGYPNWTKAENVVGNGPFLLESRRIRDRIRMVKNPHYWNAEHVDLQSIDALAIDSATTELNLYLRNQVDWIPNVPTTVIDDLKKRPDYFTGPTLGTYFYRLNVANPALKDKRVRQALNMAINKEDIVTRVTRGGQVPARSFVPDRFPGYRPAQSGKFDPEAAKKLLAAAGYPGGAGFPKLQIMYNDNETHEKIAQVVGNQLEKNLGIRVDYRKLEWATYLDKQATKDYEVCRAAWIADYNDPNTFLDMFVTDGVQNKTNWSSPEYDRLIKAAGDELDPAKRFKIFEQAEAILMDELPIVPIYFYAASNMVKPYVSGLHPTPQDHHPLSAIRIDRKQREAYLSGKESP